jgi:hypothetical protein
MKGALIGLAGLLIGALLSEYFRRSNRIEVYSQKIFERRLEIYEQLMKLVQEAYIVGCDVLEDPEASDEDRHAAVSEAVMTIAEYVDENALFVDEYIAADVTALLMGVEEIPKIQDESEREAAVSNFRSHYKAAKQNILEESGIRQINQHLKIVSGSRLDSPIIRRLKELEKKRA